MPHSLPPTVHTTHVSSGVLAATVSLLTLPFDPKPSNTMKTFQIVSFFALIASAMAFAPVDPKSESLLAALIAVKAVPEILGRRRTADRDP